MTKRSVQPSVPRLRIGCAGWSIPSMHAGLFGGGGSALERYATRFDAVEINSSFYRPHQRKTYERWAQSVPPHFRFSVKVPRSITHDLRLRQAGPLLDAFLEQAGGLGDRLGCLLVQLPPSLAFEPRQAASFFAVLRRRWAGGVACEPRHASWFDGRADALWLRHQVARVAADPARVEAAQVAAGAGALRYWRWHGSPRIYYSAYDDDALQALAERVRGDTPAGIEPWVIFDNTAHGHAIPDAARLKRLLQDRPR